VCGREGGWFFILPRACLVLLTVVLHQGKIKKYPECVKGKLLPFTSASVETNKLYIKSGRPQ
jgi:hypothetical protein